MVICDDPGTGSPLGDLVASPLSIGVDPARPVVREWTLDDPEVANLAPDAVLVGPGYSTTAAEVRAPRSEPAPAPAPPPAPAAPAAEPTPPAAVAAEPAGDDDMAWPLPTVLVLAAAGGTAVVLRRWRAMAPAAPPPAAVTGPAAPVDNRTRDAAAAGRG